MDVRWLEDAIDDVRDIHRHIAADNPQAAVRLVRRIRQAADDRAALGDERAVGREPASW